MNVIQAFEEWLTCPHKQEIQVSIKCQWVTVVEALNPEDSPYGCSLADLIGQDITINQIFSNWRVQWVEEDCNCVNGCDKCLGTANLFEVKNG